MPSIAYGTWTLGNGQGVVDQVDQALNVGFSHIGILNHYPVLKTRILIFVLDTAQIYRNELEAGQAIKESGLSRSDIFFTTKWSGMDGLDIPTSIDNSLKNVLDFYLGRITGHLLIAYMFFSLVYLTSIYILFTLRVLLSQT